MKAEFITPVALDTKQGETCAARIAERETGQSVSSVRYLGGGSFGKAYRVTNRNGNRIVVKFLRAPDMLKKEVFDLSLLAEHCSTKIPAVLFSHTADDRIPFDCYGMEEIEGKTVLKSLGMWLCSKQKKHDFSLAVTRHQHSIHQCVSDRFGDTMNPTFDTWQACYRPFAEAILNHAERFRKDGKLSAKIFSVLSSAWEKFDLIFSEPVKQAVLIHGDLNIGNIMVDRKKQLSGFIDPLNCMYADVEYDLFQFDNFGKCFGLSNTYAAQYGVSRLWREKLAFYGLWNEVYCYMKSGVYVPVIMNPLLKNMQKILRRL